MRMLVVVTMVGLGGCASQAKIEEGAYRHQQRAREYEARGDYKHAEEQREAANKQFEKAGRRGAMWRGSYRAY